MIVTIQFWIMNGYMSYFITVHAHNYYVNIYIYISVLIKYSIDFKYTIVEEIKK